MDLIKKLDECETRLKEIQDLIMDPELVKDQKKYKDTMRENGYLTDVCALYEEYKKAYETRRAIIDSLYKEIKIIKKLKV